MSVANAWDAAERMLGDLVGPGQSDTTRRVAHDHLVTFARAVIDRIAELSEALGEQAGVGGMETAGHLVSYLNEQPLHLEALLCGGVFELSQDWIERGTLTYQANNGQIVDPAYARRARLISQWAKGVAA